jgi:transcriptional regulator with XRE-family HTH domain
MYQPSRSEGGTLKALRTAAHQALLRILVRARDRADFTQTELAHRLGRSQSWVSNIERGERRLEAIEFAQLCRELNLQPGRVLGRLPLPSRRSAKSG